MTGVEVGELLKTIPGAETELAKVTACETVEGCRRRPDDALSFCFTLWTKTTWCGSPQLFQRAKVEAYVTAEGFELVELLSDSFESAEDPAFFKKGFQLLEEGQADVLLFLKLEAGGRSMPWTPWTEAE